MTQNSVDVRTEPSGARSRHRNPAIRRQCCRASPKRSSASSATATLADTARVRLEALGYRNVAVVVGDGFARRALKMRHYSRIHRHRGRPRARPFRRPLVEQAGGGRHDGAGQLGPAWWTRSAIVKLTKSEEGLVRQDLIWVRFRSFAARKSAGTVEELVRSNVDWNAFHSAPEGVDIFLAGISGERVECVSLILRKRPIRRSAVLAAKVFEDTYVPPSTGPAA